MTYDQGPQDPHLWQSQPGGAPQPPYSAQPPAVPQQPYVYGYASPYQPYGVQPIYVQAVPHSGVATASLVLGIIGLCIGWCTFGLPSAAAVILGHAGLVETKNGQRSGRGAAIAGLILGYLLVIPGVFLAVAVFTGGLLEDSSP